MKMTERDKILLIFLAIILVVAIVVVLPGFGVMSCNDKVAEYKDKSADLDEELDDALAELRSMGVDPLYAERRNIARERLENKIFDLKQEASRLAGNIMAYAQTYAVDEQWIDGLEYRYGVASDDSERIVSYDKTQDVTGEANKDTEYTINDTIYTLKSARRTIQFSVTSDAQCVYGAELTLEGYRIEDMGAMLLYIQHLTSKGSLLIDNVKYDTKTNTGSVSFIVLMTSTDGISRYAQEIAEKLAEEEEGEEEE